MDEHTRQRLEDAGWTVGEVDDLLDLSDADRVVIEVRLRLYDRLERLRDASTEPAKADVEPIEDASIEELVAALAELGDGLEDIAEAIRAD